MMQRTLVTTLGALAIVACARPAGAMTVEGTVLYEKIPATTRGLDLKHPIDAPAAQIRVELRATDKKTVLARSATDGSGTYHLEVADGTRQVVLVAWSEMGEIQVGDPADSTVYGVSWSAFDPAKPRHQSVIPDQDRLSGPFNILADISKANRAIEAVEPGLRLADDPLVVWWSPSNSDGTYFDFRENAAYIKGQRDVDSDEFDDSVILHEYGHYLAARFSKDDSPGGEHVMGDRLDPRVAWSEGWGTYFAQSILGHSIYIDTMGPDGVDTSSIDLEEDVPEWDHPGYWSEHSVGSSLWDVEGPAGRDGNHLGLGLKPIWSVFHGYLPTQPFVYLLTMVDGLVQSDEEIASGLTAILANRSINYQAGVVPPVAVPFPMPISPDVPVTGSVDSLTRKRTNLLDSANYYIFRIESDRDITVQLKETGARKPDAAKLVLRLYNAQGDSIASADALNGVGSTERLEKSLPAGTYVIGVESYLRSRWSTRYGSGSYELTAHY